MPFNDGDETYDEGHHTDPCERVEATQKVIDDFHAAIGASAAITRSML